MAHKNNPEEQTMNILLIAPASGPWREIGKQKLFNGKTFRFSMLSLLTVAALSPKNAKVRIIDEQVEDIPDEPFDLVGITAMTAAAPRAYALCDTFRGKGIPVVLGGFHATLNTEEALQHADAVVRGPAYGAWQQLCDDVERGTLDRVYEGDPEGAIPVHLPRHLVSKDSYVTMSSTFATLGCRNRCQFCSISAFHQGARHARPVGDVVDELRKLNGRFFIFVDDNLTQDRAYALELCRALRPLKQLWGTQASIDVADDPELLRAMHEAGCRGIFIGLESFNETALKSQEKGFNQPARYREAVARLHAHGIFVEAGVIVGFDSDSVETFQRTLDMLEETGIDMIQLSILTPLPGTPLHHAMADRIHDSDWAHYDYRHVVFEPAGMTAEELQAGSDWLIRKFYSPARILKRSLRWLRLPGGWKYGLYPLGLNLAYYGRVLRFKIRGFNPARERTRRQARRQSTCRGSSAATTRESHPTTNN